MPISFPTSPSINQTYTYGNKTWIWDGTKWNINFNYLQSVQGWAGVQGTTGKVLTFLNLSLKNTASYTYTNTIAAGTYFVKSSRSDVTTTIGANSVTGNGTISVPSDQSSIIISSPKYYYPRRPPNFAWYNYPQTTPAYGNGVWVIPDSYQIYTASDNTFSSVNTINIPSSAFPLELRFLNGLFIYGAESNKLAVSTNGTSWTARTPGFGTTSIYALTYGNGLYVAGGGAGILQTSTDTITWTTQVSNFGTTTIYSLAYGNGIYIAGGTNGTLRSSTDGITWTTQISNFGTTEISDILYDGNKFIAVGSNTIVTSTDGTTWIVRHSGSVNPIGLGILTCISYNGSNGYIATSNSNIMGYSTDGITWTSRAYSPTNPGGQIHSSFGNGIFLIISSQRSSFLSSEFSDGLGTNIFNTVTTLSNINQSINLS